ncbi:DUF3592 domain-containing protein [Larkinella bovis]|uniref:DUF3592 domain-containing protein n=1 Tax=Larkinella bovis TaxID=683041 RepID=A0ABW0I4J4_9BACT
MKLPGGDLFTLLFFFIGVTLVGIGYGLYHSRQQLIRKGIATQGLVIDLHRVKPHEYPLAPSIRYRTADGQERVFHSSLGRNPPAYQIGEEVTLYYDPKQPDRVQLQGDYLLVYVLGGIGSIFLLLSVWSVPEALRAVWQWALG